MEVIQTHANLFVCNLCMNKGFISLSNGSTECLFMTCQRSLPSHLCLWCHLVDVEGEGQDIQTQAPECLL